MHILTSGTYEYALKEMQTDYEQQRSVYRVPRNNKKFWEELICLLFLHRLTVHNIKCHHLHTKFHPNPPTSTKVAPTSEV
jgi:hypothetical protein